MKLLFTLFIAIFFAASVCAQEAQPANTFYDFTEAKEYARAHDLPILMVFAGSDWCKPCIQFKRGVLLREQFQNYTKDHLVILYLDFPAKKRNKLSPEQTAHNERLAAKYNAQGAFPSLLVLTHNATIIGQLSFTGQSSQEFIESLEQLTESDDKS